jgi:WG containing repeat
MKFFSVGFVLLCFFCQNASAQMVGNKFQWILPLQSNIIPFGVPSPNAIALREEGKIALLSTTGEKKMLTYDSISNLDGNFWTIWKDGLRGIFHTDKGELLPPVYHSILPITKIDANWAFLVQKYGMSAIVDDQNRLLLPYQKSPYARMALLSDTILAYLRHDVYNFVNADFLFISKNGNKVSDAIARQFQVPDFQRISSDKYLLVTYRNGLARRDTFTAAEKFLEDVAIVKSDSLWGYIRRDGSWLIPPRFQAALPLDALGHGVVKSKGKYGIVRQDGAFLVEPRFAFLKNFAPGLYEFKEGGRLGVVDSMGKILLPAGEFAGFQVAGTACFAAKSGDSLLVFQRNGTPMPLGNVLNISLSNDAAFWVKQRDRNDRRQVVSGVMNPSGKWLINNVLKGSTSEYRHFFVAEAVVEPCCNVGSLNIGSNQPGRFLIFDRNGKPLLTSPVDRVERENLDAQFLVYRSGKKFGLVSASEGQLLKPEFDLLKVVGNTWILAQKDNKWGVLKWVE